MAWLNGTGASQTSHGLPFRHASDLSPNEDRVSLQPARVLLRELDPRPHSNAIFHPGLVTPARSCRFVAVVPSQFGPGCAALRKSLISTNRCKGSVGEGAKSKCR